MLKFPKVPEKNGNFHSRAMTGFEGVFGALSSAPLGNIQSRAMTGLEPLCSRKKGLLTPPNIRRRGTLKKPPQPSGDLYSECSRRVGNVPGTLPPFR